MSAIITHDFRVDTTEKFVDSLSSSTYYMGLGHPGSWPVDGGGVEQPPAAYENDKDMRDVWNNLVAAKILAADDGILSVPRHTWATGTTDYKAYDDANQNLEGDIYHVVDPTTYNVYICLKVGLVSGTSTQATSTVNPNTIGTPASGVSELADGYIWKYLYTIPGSVANSFLTVNYMPVPRVTSSTQDGGIFVNQWNVQQAAVDGAIYRIKVTAAGSGYSSSPTVTVIGDGSSATATAVVDSSGTIVDIEMTANGSGYVNATIEITDSSGAGAEAVAVLPPPGGFGYRAVKELRAHYATFTKSFDGHESNTIPDAFDFRQISIIKDPNDSSGAASTTTYNGCKKFTVAGSFTSGEAITGATSGAKGTIVEYTGGDLFYIQDDSTGFEPFVSGETVTGSTGNTSSLADGELELHTGNVIFVENRDPVTRGSGQIETIRLVIEF